MSNNIFNFTIQGMTYNVLDFSEIKIVTGDKADGKDQFPRQHVELYQHIDGTINYTSRMWVDTLYLANQADGDFRYYLGDSRELQYALPNGDWVYEQVNSVYLLRDLIDYLNKTECDFKATYWTWGSYGENLTIDFTMPVDVLATID